MGYTYATIKKIRSDQEFSETETFLLGRDDHQFLQKFQDTVSRSPYYQDGSRHKLRKNGVRAVLITCFYQNEPELDFSRWEQKVRVWIDGKFLRNGDTELCWKSEPGDGSGSVQILLIPLTQEGKVSYDSYFGTKTDFYRYIDGYCSMMKIQFGCEKAPRSVIRVLTQKTQPFSSKKPDAILPEPENKESARQYYLRIKDLFLDNTLAGMSEEMQKIQKLQSENEKLKKHLLPLLELTERYGSPGKWKAMITTALKIQYAIRSYQANGDKESIAQAMKILKDGEEYMKEHHISG